MLLINDKEYNMKLSSLGFLLTGTVLLTACGGSDNNTENTPKPDTPVPVQPVKLPDNFSGILHRQFLGNSGKKACCRICGILHRQFLGCGQGP